MKVLEPKHTAENPRLVRLSSTVHWDTVFEEFVTQGPVFDVASDLLGESVRFHHSKLNFKWHSGGDAVGWHQDPVLFSFYREWSLFVKTAGGRSATGA